MGIRIFGEGFFFWRMGLILGFWVGSAEGGDWYELVSTLNSTLLSASADLQRLVDSRAGVLDLHSHQIHVFFSGGYSRTAAKRNLIAGRSVRL